MKNVLITTAVTILAMVMAMLFVPVQIIQLIAEFIPNPRM